MTYTNGRLYSDSVNLGSNPSPPATETVDIPQILAADMTDKANEQRTDGRTQVGTAADNGIYIIAAGRGHRIKVGMSRVPQSRLYQLSQAHYEKLTLVFFGILGEPTAEIEETIKRKLLKPWKVRGEWFDASPFLAGIAIEAARDACPRRRAFLEIMAKAYAAQPNWKLEAELDEQAEIEFPDLHARLRPEVNKVIGLGGRGLILPPTKYTRLIVEGFPEIAWGAPQAPPLVKARTNSRSKK